MRSSMLQRGAVTALHIFYGILRVSMKTQTEKGKHMQIFKASGRQSLQGLRSCLPNYLRQLADARIISFGNQAVPTKGGNNIWFWYVLVRTTDLSPQVVLKQPSAMMYSSVQEPKVFGTRSANNVSLIL
ncbi:unnamed protein product [Durusdinium trenchii]|uniref:Uncharacterized protein n=1 Tax=Durusdinium trenchii TaxID=1381693 RepID=A0ABP0J7B8_9DINO